MGRIVSSQWLRFAIYLAVLLPLMTMRDVTPDNELKYLSIADEALRDGHLWCLFNHGTAYADKPPLYIWIIMFFKQLLGFHCIPLLELFSLIPSFVILGTFNRWVRPQFSARPAADNDAAGFRDVPPEKVAESKWLIAAELALFTSVYFLGASIVLRMDMLMVMFITLSMFIFWKMYRGEYTLRNRLLFPVFIFLAIFSKGPVGIMVPLFCIPVYLLAEHNFRFMGKCWGWLTWSVLALLCAFWWVNAYKEGGKPYIDNLLFHQTVDRAVDAFHHKRPVYFYAYSIWYAMAPWSLVAIPTIIAAIVKRIRIDSLTRFFLVCSATIFAMLSLVSSKLEIYLLPMFGFTIYGSMLTMRRAGWTLPAKIMTMGGCIMLAAALAAGCLVTRANDRIGLSSVCSQAREISEKEGIIKFGAFNLKGAGNMDVYLGHPVENLNQEQMTDIRDRRSLQEGIIVFTKGDDGRTAQFEIFRPTTTDTVIPDARQGI